MADNRIKRSNNKNCSVKEQNKWNIPPEMDSSVDLSSDSKGRIDSLFDSGYISQTVSKTSIDFESDFDQKLTISATNCSKSELSSTDKREAKQWTDSGLSITSDSGLNIEEEDIVNDENIEKNWTKSNYSKSLDLLREAFEPRQDGDTYLHLSIIKGLKDITISLIRIVPHPDFLDITNHLLQSPLHLAALTGQTDIVRRLIICGATVDLRDRHGNTALHIACAESNFDCVVQILNPITEKEMRDAKVVNYPIIAHNLPKEFLELKNYEGETCLHLVAYNKYNESNKKSILNTIEYLVKRGADINAQEGKSGKSILHWSVETKNPDLVQFLVSRCKADVNVRSYAGHTPLYMAWLLFSTQTNSSAKSKLKTIIKYLCECGAEPSQQPVFDSDSDSEED